MASISSTCSSSLRQWRVLNAAQDHLKAPKVAGLRVLTFNILSESYLDTLQPHAYPELLHSKQRKYHIFDEILRHTPDFACLQEMDAHHYKSYFSRKLKEFGYKSLYKGRCTSKTDGIATFWNAERFKLVTAKALSYRSTGIMNRDHVGHILLFEENKRSRKLIEQTDWLQNSRVNSTDTSSPSTRPSYYILANTHILFNPNRGDIKFGQLLMFFKAIVEMIGISKRMAQSCSPNNRWEAPVLIVCGDYNIAPDSVLYQFISKGLYDFTNVNKYYSSGQRHEDRSKVLHGSFENATHLHKDTQRESVSTGDTKTQVGSPGMEWISEIEMSIDTRLFKSSQLADTNELTFHTIPAFNKELTNYYFMPFTLRSAYFAKRNYNDYPTECPCTSFSQSTKRCIDYIWYSPKYLQVCAIYEPPEEHFYDTFTDIPNKEWKASDHFSLVVDFQLLEVPLEKNV